MNECNVVGGGTVSPDGHCEWQIKQESLPIFLLACPCLCRTTIQHCSACSHWCSQITVITVETSQLLLLLPSNNVQFKFLTMSIPAPLITGTICYIVLCGVLVGGVFASNASGMLSKDNAG